MYAWEEDKRQEASHVSPTVNASIDYCSFAEGQTTEVGDELVYQRAAKTFDNILMFNQKGNVCVQTLGRGLATADQHD